MTRQSRSIGPRVLRLLTVLLLLGWPRMGATAGTWSVISLTQQPGEVYDPAALAADAAGNLYVADRGYGRSGSARLQKRDAQGNWSIVATAGDTLGQVDTPTALAVGTAGDLYVADGARLQKRDGRGNCYENRTPGSVQAGGTPAAPRLAEATGR
jgi:hypothetical protein